VGYQLSAVRLLVKKIILLILKYHFEGTILIMHKIKEEVISEV